MEPTRRSFLKQSAAILGFPFLGCREFVGPVANPPAWFEEAMARMLEENKLGVLIVLPGNTRDRRELAGALEMLLDYCRENRCVCGEYPRQTVQASNVVTLCELCERVREIFSQAVFVCVERSVVDACVRSARGEDTFLVFDSDRRVLDGAALKPDALMSASAFVSTMERILHGPGRIRLGAKADAIRWSLTDEEHRALKRLASREDEDVLAASARRIIPLLVLERMEAVEGRLERLRSILRRYSWDAPILRPGPRLPYGIVAAEDRGCCGSAWTEEEDVHVSVACGRGRVVPGARSFIRYLR